jgi:hypothetical protein
MGAKTATASGLALRLVAATRQAWHVGAAAPPSSVVVEVLVDPAQPTAGVVTVEGTIYPRLGDRHVRYTSGPLVFASVDLQAGAPTPDGTGPAGYLAVAVQGAVLPSEAAVLAAVLEAAARLAEAPDAA